MIPGIKTNIMLGIPLAFSIYINCSKIKYDQLFLVEACARKIHQTTTFNDGNNAEPV